MKTSKMSRSEIMSSVPSKNTSIEKIVCKYLFSHGFRYRKNVQTLPGTPDIVLKKYATVVFVNGCFWHGHQICHRFRIPKSRNDYWQSKIDKNIARDKSVGRLLQEKGWKVLIVWECEIREDFEGTLKRVIDDIRGVKNDNQSL